MIKYISNKTFLIGLVFIISTQLYGMLPAEQLIIAYMANPTHPSEGSLATLNDMRSAYLLSFTGWKDVGTVEFQKALGEYIENPSGFIMIQRFMEKVNLRGAPLIRHDNPDGTSIFIKEFKCGEQWFSMSQSSLSPDVVMLSNKSLPFHHPHKLYANTVYPKLIARK